MNQAFYFDELYPLQDTVLALINGLKSGFYLSGGTAASRGYLHHRFSDDLDFFVNDAPDFELQCARVIDALERESSWSCRTALREKRFARLFLKRGSVELKLEFINDVPLRIGIPAQHAVLGRLDSAENILANKITAIIDRREPKDFADIWGFCTLMNLNLTAAIAGAQGKAAGIFAPDLARALLDVRRSDWETVLWISPPDPEAFLSGVTSLGESLILPSSP